MVPRVETALQAEAMVAYFRYPPRGIRGSAQSVIRGASYGLDADGYMERFVETHLLALQIESVDGFAAREAIAATDGVGMLFFGPADYAASLAVPMDHPEVFAAARAVAACAKSHGLYAGTVLFPGATPQSLAEAGMTHISVTGDVGTLTAGFASAISEART
jgi:2-keto-3-deoxy-L-rhamnonate aldolase RhmA